MAWIESHTVLGRHRKVLLMAAALHIPSVHLVGHLTMFWHAILEQQEDGDLSLWPDQVIEAAAAWTSEPNQFANALREFGWLDGHLVHDWIDYAGHFLVKKYSTANREKLIDIWKRHGLKYGKRDAKSLHRIANRKRTKSEPQANLPNLTRPNLTRPNQEEDPADDFEIFWNAYPRKIGKKEALKAWGKASGKPSLDDLLAAVEKQKASVQWTKDGGQFIPHPATWLNQGRWDDVPLTAQPGADYSHITKFLQRGDT